MEKEVMKSMMSSVLEKELLDSEENGEPSPEQKNSAKALSDTVADMFTETLERLTNSNAASSPSGRTPAERLANVFSNLPKDEEDDEATE